MKNKIFLIAVVVILIGVIVAVIFGFNMDEDYKGYTMGTIDIGTDFNISDIKQITDEVFPNQKVRIHKRGDFYDGIVIKTAEINQEHIDSFITKINEKYSIEKTASDMKVTYIPRYRVIDIVKPYIVYSILIFATAVVYMAIRYRKLGLGKVVSRFAILTVMAEALYFAVIAITRCKFNSIAVPGAIALMFAITTFMAYNNEKKLDDIKENK